MRLLDSFSQLFSQLTGQQLKILLEMKHLYQKVSIQPNAIITQLKEKVGPESQVYFEQIQKHLQGPFSLTDNPTFAGANSLELWLPVKNVELFCEKCGTSLF